MIALIPARGGSKRIERKNIKPLAGHPLMEWTLEAADVSNIFDNIVVCSDDDEALAIGQRWGCDLMRRVTVADEQPDIEWVRTALEVFGTDSFAILRPTSPFRTADTIRRAYQQFKTSEVHSIRAVEPAKQNPFKMWTLLGAGYPMKPLLERYYEQTPLHSMPSQTAPKVYIQNASLEMAWTYVVKSFGTISGHKISPFFTHGYEGFDINTPEDWAEAERLIAEGLVELPRVDVAGVSATPSQN